MSVIHISMFEVHGTMMMIHIAFALKHNTNIRKCSTYRYNTCGGYTMLYGTTAVVQNTIVCIYNEYSTIQAHPPELNNVTIGDSTSTTIDCM